MAAELTGDSPKPPDREAYQAASARHVGAERTAKPPVCDLCGAPMLERHCKLICPRCGYIRDCSDP